MDTRRTFLAGLGLGATALVAAFASAPPKDKNSKDKNRKAGQKVNTLPTTEAKAPEGRELATLGGGCFWCTEAIFLDLKGVDKVVSGYAGGHLVKPTYEQVCSGTTGHAEVIQVTFDPKTVSFKELLEVFLTTHDPTTLNRQGADEGTQYRSAIFFHSDKQKETAQEVIKEFEAQKIWPDKIVTEVTPFTNFYAAEEYHQNYFARNGNAGYCRIVIAPKVAKFRAKFREKLKK